MNLLNRSILVLTALLCATATAGDGASGTAVRRHALLIGTNDGGKERVRLRYAVTDAQNFARVLSEVGGVDPVDLSLLQEASREEVLRGLTDLRARLEASKRPGQRSEIILYYSGHSDDEGLLLEGERLAYVDLRKALETLPADVRIAILDSCSSGTMARKKGGVRRPAFLMDASSSVKGQAILTSSSSDEASQESDRIGGSYFTHHLVSGLRGAADSTRDGRVTLSEAYQFAFQETLSRTERSRAGPQHPSWDIDLAGAGEVVLTDLRSTDAGLAFAAELEGRLFVRDASERLVAEIHKARGERTELAVAPGSYQIIRERDGSRWRTAVSVTAGGRAPVLAHSFTAMPVEVTVSRGDTAPAAQPRSFVNVSLVPWLATNDLLGGQVDNHVSFGLVAARAHRVDGVAFSTVANWVDTDVYGVQVGGALNVARGDQRGLAIAGALNVGGGEARGGQVAGAANVNVGHVRGGQIGGAFNYAGGLSGFQIAGAANVAGTLHGAQLSVVNVGGDVSGMQFGVVNIASRVRGLQLGVINVGGEVDGASVGLLSFVRNGQLHAEAWSSDVSFANVGVKFGSKHAYTLLFAGANNRVENHGWSLGAALGAHIPFERFFIDTDIGAQNFYGNNLRAQSTSLFHLRVMAGVPITGRLAVIVGPSLNMATTFEGPLGSAPTFMPTFGSENFRFWPGLQAGLRY